MWHAYEMRNTWKNVRHKTSLGGPTSRHTEGTTMFKHEFGGSGRGRGCAWVALAQDKIQRGHAMITVMKSLPKAKLSLIPDH
jgi:hypothetical protein